MTSSKNKKVKTISPVFDLVHGLAALGVVALGVVGHRARQAESEEGLIFLSDQQSNWMTCLWCVLTNPVMRVHFALFKHATWLSERVEFDAVDEEEEAPDLFEDEELRPLSMACFCRASLIPALESLGFYQ